VRRFALIVLIALGAGLALAPVAFGMFSRGFTGFWHFEGTFEPTKKS
jgi:hypothetical protein